DSRWNQWQELVLGTVEPHEGGPTEVQALPDAFAVQFPTTVTDGMERPYFLMGNAREPVYLWRWNSQQGRGEEAIARGLGQIEPLAADQQTVTAQGAWDNGEWAVVMSRPLATGTGESPTFPTGQAIPIAFFAWDGDNSESGTRGSISTWYYLHLDVPGSNSIYFVPVAATLLTFVLGLTVVARAQRQPRRPAVPDHSQT